MSDSLYDKVTKGEHFDELAEVFKDYSKVADVVNKRISNKLKMSYDIYKVTKQSSSTDRCSVHIYIKIGDLSAISLHDDVGRLYLHWFVYKTIQDLGITYKELDSWCMYDFCEQSFTLSLRWVTC
jgi:hypothetical protein